MVTETINKSALSRKFTAVDNSLQARNFLHNRNKAKFMQGLQHSFREMKEGKTRPVECLIYELENASNY